MTHDNCDLPKDERDEGDCDNQYIQKVETRSAKGSWMKD